MLYFLPSHKADKSLVTFLLSIVFGYLPTVG